ncbi:MAG: M14 family zinc carboxypeptidase, partial [Euryarchaeota archaeon]|nr:M14 family zinc carboxypeptidase [Euryarchaeota archaeon]
MKLKILAIGIMLVMLSNPLLATAKLNNNNTKNTEKEHYYSYSELTDLLGQLQKEYPEIFNYSSLGKTWEDRDIWLVKISDNVIIDEKEPGVLYTGGQHGDEK